MSFHPVRRALTCLALALAASLLCACEKTPRVIKIGVAQPLSGALAPMGQDLLNGAEMAAAELNEQALQVDGRPIRFEIVPADDHADPETGRAVARQLVAAGVVAVIGHMNSGVSIAAAPIYAGAHVAQLSTSTHPQFTRLGFPGTFRLVANDDLQARAIGNFSASQLKTTRFAVLDDGTLYGRDLARRAAELLEGTDKHIVLTRSMDNKTTDFADLAEHLKASGTQTMVSTLSDFQQISLLESLKKIKYTNIGLLGGDFMKTAGMLQGADGIESIFATSPILEATEFPGGSAFLAKYRVRFHREPAYAGHYTYDAMYVLAFAISRTRDASPASVIEELKRVDGFAPVSGSMRWDATGEPRYGVVGIYRLHDRAWELQMRSDVW